MLSPFNQQEKYHFHTKLAFEEGISVDVLVILLIKQYVAAKCVQHTRNILADVKIGNFNSTFKTCYFIP